MLNIIIAVIGIASFANFGFSQGARVMFRDLPDPVQREIRGQKDNIERIEQFSYNGRTVYEVKLKEQKSDEEKSVYIGEDGNRIKDKAIKSQRQADRKNLNLKNLPKAVQQTYKKEAGSAQMDDIDVTSVNGRTVYEIDYTRDGKFQTVRIQDDGSLVRDRANRRDARNDDRRVLDTPNNPLNRPVPSNAQNFDRPLASTQKVNFDSIPEAVKRTARSVAGSNRIEDTERGTLDGRSVYEIAFKENGVHSELRVAEDGSVVQRIGGQAANAANPIPGSLTVDQVPAPVRRTIRAQVGSGEVNDIDKMIVKGRTVYEVGFKREKGGRQQEILIAEDGSVIGEPAGAR